MAATKVRNQTMSVHQLACQDADIAGFSWAGLGLDAIFWRYVKSATGMAVKQTMVC